MKREKKNKEIVESWSKEKQKLYFWFWCGYTHFGDIGISPYDKELMNIFNKRCGEK